MNVLQPQVGNARDTQLPRGKSSGVGLSPEEVSRNIEALLAATFVSAAKSFLRAIAAVARRSGFLRGSRVDWRRRRLNRCRRLGIIFDEEVVLERERASGQREHHEQGGDRSQAHFRSLPLPRGRSRSRRQKFPLGLSETMPVERRPRARLRYRRPPTPPGSPPSRLSCSHDSYRASL